MTLSGLSPLELSGGAKKKKLVKSKLKKTAKKNVKKGTAKRSKTKKSKSKSKSKSKRSKSKSKSKRTKSKSKSKSKRTKSKSKKNKKKSKNVFGYSKEVQKQLLELQELERDILNRRSIEKKLQREQELENMQINRPITNIEPYVSSSYSYEKEQQLSPYIESEVYLQPTPIRKKSSKKIIQPQVQPQVQPYMSPSLERIPTPYVQQTNFTPPPAYTADEDALESTDSPVTVFGADNEDLSYRK